MNTKDLETLLSKYQEKRNEYHDKATHASAEYAKYSTLVEAYDMKIYALCFLIKDEGGTDF
jgi:hypothetical protein